MTTEAENTQAVTEFLAGLLRNAWVESCEREREENAESEGADMISTNDIPYGQSFIAEFTLDVRDMSEYWLDWRKSLRYALQKCQDFIGYKLLVHGIFFDAVAETELWFADSYPDVKVTMIAVTKQKQT